MLIQLRVEKSLRDTFANRIYEGMIPQIMRIIDNGKTPKAMHLATIKSSGKKDGLEVYRTLKLMPDCKVV